MSENDKKTVRVDVELVGFFMAAIKSLGESILESSGLSAARYSETHEMLADLEKQIVRCETECIDG